MPDLTRRYHHPRSAVASTRVRSAFFLFRVPTLFSARRFPFLFAERPTAPTYEHARTRSALRHDRARERTHALAHTHAQERPTTNDATCGPPAWLTGRLHEGGIRSVRSPPRRAPLSSRPLSPRPCKAAAPRKARPFCFLNYYCLISWRSKRGVAFASNDQSKCFDRMQLGIQLLHIRLLYQPNADDTSQMHQLHSELMRRSAFRVRLPDRVPAVGPPCHITQSASQGTSTGCDRANKFGETVGRGTSRQPGVP